jgi:hypothetical protein
MNNCTNPDRAKCPHLCGDFCLKESLALRPPSERISVHHVKERASVEADLHIYCGRGEPKNQTMINGHMGNIHWMASESQRDAVCDAFAADMAQSDHPYWPSVRRLTQRLAEGKTIALYCFCAPKRCHADTIRELALAGLNTNKKDTLK